MRCAVLGDPIAHHVSPYTNEGTDNPATYVFRAGDHHDGMYYFGLGSNGRYNPYISSRGLLCLNHEAITPAFVHPAGPTVVGGVRTIQLVPLELVSTVPFSPTTTNVPSPAATPRSHAVVPLFWRFHWTPSLLV